MSIEIAEERPPYVTFENRPVEDRAASIEAGHYVAKDVVYAIITPSGSRDRIERVAADWISHIKRESRNGRFPANWVSHYEKALEQWQKDQEVPVDGIPLRDWPGLSPAQYRTLQEIGIMTVEALASANEEALGYMGIGGRALKQRAITYLSTSADSGKIAERCNALEVENAALKTQVEQLTADCKNLAKLVDQLQPNAKAVKPQKPDDKELTFN